MIARRTVIISGCTSLLFPWSWSQSEPAKIVPTSSPQQVDLNVQWWALDPGHADYASIFSQLAATASSVPAKYGPYAVVSGGNGYTGFNIVGPTYIADATIAGQANLAISSSGCVKDRFNYSKSYNPNYAAPTPHTNAWGDQYAMYGQFLNAPGRIPTTGEDRRLNNAKGVGSNTVLYVTQTARGTGSGTSYANAKAIKDIIGQEGASPTHGPTAYAIIVLCGNLSRFKNEGNGFQFGAQMFFKIKNGSAVTRTQIVAHPVVGGGLMGGCKLGSGESGVTYNEDATWTSEGDGTFSCQHTNHLTLENFVMSDAGGTLRPLTKTASVLACKALADSYYTTNSKTYVHLADGSDPHQTTYFGIHVFNGVRVMTLNTQFFDFFGVGIYQQPWRGLDYHDQNGNFGLYACKIGYIGGGRKPFIQVLEPASSNAALGTFSSTPHQPSNRIYQGNDIRYCSDGFYDACNFDFSPLNTTLRDNYFYKIGANDYGMNLGNSDSHSMCCQSARGWYCLNNTMDSCGWMTINVYLNGALYDEAPAGKEDTPLYTIGYPPAYSSVNFVGEAGLDFIYHQPAKDIEIAYNLIKNPITFADNSALADSGEGIALHGDNRHFGYGGQIRNVRVHHNRIEGAFRTAAIKTKFKPDLTTSSYTDVEIAYNVVRGAVVGFTTTATTATDSFGNTIEPSFWFHHNDIHATKYFVILPSVSNPTLHDNILEYNIYRKIDGAHWRIAGVDKKSLKTWQAAAPAGDIYDTNSMHVGLGHR